jgi:hypothetical protein
LLPFRWSVAAIEATLMLVAGPLGGPAIELAVSQSAVSSMYWGTS